MTTDRDQSGETPEARAPLNPDTSNILPGAFGPSPSQTLGPYFHQGLIRGFQGYGALAGPEVVDAARPEGPTLPGERLCLTGRVLDADGTPIPDAMIEVWQADAAGRYASGPGAAFGGFARVHTRTPDARYQAQLVKPGPAGPDEAPRLLLWVGMRGLLTHLYTVVYFGDEDNSRDAVLASVPPHRRHTLMARRGDVCGRVTYTFDLRMQGPDETVFFAP